MGAGGFHGRVRDGIGCGPSAMATRSSGRIGFWRGVLTVLCVEECCAWRSGLWGPRLPASGSELCRAISTGWLRTLLPLHARPIDVMVFHGPRGDLV